jgi:hypothetical protein
MKLTRRSAMVAAALVTACVLLATGSGSPAFTSPVPVVRHVARNPLDVPPPITRTTPRRVHIHLVAREVVAELAHGTRYLFLDVRACRPRPGRGARCPRTDDPGDGG